MQMVQVQRSSRAGWVGPMPVRMGYFPYGGGINEGGHSDGRLRYIYVN